MKVAQVPAAKTGSTAKHYAYALLATALALVLRQFLAPFFGPSFPFVTIWGAIIFSVWFCGTGPSILSVLTGVIGAWYWFLLPAHSLIPQGTKQFIPGTIGFLLMSAFIIVLGAAHRRSKSRLELELSSRLQIERALHDAQRLAHMGNWTWDPSSDAVTWSEGVYRIRGFDPKSPAPSFFAQQSLYAPESWQRLQAAVQNTLQTGHGYDLELDMFRTDGTPICVMVHAEPELDAAGRVLKLFGTIQDITATKRTEQSLRESEERLRIAQKAGHSGTWEWNFLTSALITSPEMRDLFGFDPSNAAGDREIWRDIVHPDDLLQVDKQLQHALETRTEYHVEFRITRPDGAVRWMESLGRIFYDADGKPLRNIGVTTDITERKASDEALRKSHQELEQKVHERTHALAATLARLQDEIEVRKQREQVLRDLSARVLRLQDEERRRIARDLHDSTGQTLTALKMALASFKNSGGEISKAPDQFAEMNLLAAQALQDIRSLSHLLHPPLLDEVGFSSAASWYVDGFSKRSGIDANLEYSELPQFSKEAELAFFRVLQESLTNVLRHSASKKVHIRVYPDAGNAVLLIRDFGRGIPPDKLTKFDQIGGGVGLSGMKARLKELGGNLTLECDGTGTCVIATLPLVEPPPSNLQEDQPAGASHVAAGL